MKFIVLRRRNGGARVIPAPTSWVLAGTACVLLCTALGVVTGFALGRGGDAVPQEHLQAMRADLEAQQSELAEIRSAARDDLNALTLRMGELNAGMIRLNALGRRLTDMAGLEDGEFDFANPPAMGGDAELLEDFHNVDGAMPGLMADLDALEARLQDRGQQLDLLQDLMLDRELQARVSPKGRPVLAGWLSSSYGRRTDPFTGKPAWHKGVDFAGKRGSDIIAVGAGVVTWADDLGGYGQMVEISHGNGYFTRYGHLSGSLVNVGDHVEQGDVIALMGSSGRSTGPHLHFEVWHNGRTVNPYSYIRQAAK